MPDTLFSLLTKVTRCDAARSPAAAAAAHQRVFMLPDVHCQGHEAIGSGFSYVVYAAALYIRKPDATIAKQCFVPFLHAVQVKDLIKGMQHM